MLSAEARSAVISSTRSEPTETAPVPTMIADIEPSQTMSTEPAAAEEVPVAEPDQKTKTVTIQCFIHYEGLLREIIISHAFWRLSSFASKMVSKPKEVLSQKENTRRSVP